MGIVGPRGFADVGSKVGAIVGVARSVGFAGVGSRVGATVGVVAAGLAGVGSKVGAVVGNAGSIGLDGAGSKVGAIVTLTVGTGVKSGTTHVDVGDMVETIAPVGLAVVVTRAVGAGMGVVDAGIDTRLLGPLHSPQVAGHTLRTT